MPDKPADKPTTESVETKVEADTSLRDELEKALEPEEASEDTPEAEPVEEPDKVETAPEEPESEEEPVSDDGAEKTDDKPEDVDAPAHWSLEHQELFRGQTPEAQKFLLDRSKDMEAAHTKRSQEIAPLRKSIEKWQPYLDKVGATADQAFDTLIAAEYTLRTGTEAQKIDALTKLARDYGIALGETKANGADQDYLTADIQKAVQPLQEQVSQLQSNLQTREQQMQKAQADQSVEQIRLFKEAKTEAGQLAHPYYDEVELDMTRLAQAEVASGQVPVLQTLYDTAIWANPTVRAKLQSAQQHAAKKQEERARKEKVEKAKQASVSVAGSSSAPTEQPKSLRETLKEQFAQA